MVVPPGWNVTEPLGLAIRLYRIAEQLQYAPEAAKDFKSKIRDFGESLQELQEIFKRLGDGGPPALSLEGFSRLKTELLESQECIERCEEFSERFVALTAQGSKKAAVASKARWLWNKDRAEQLTGQIEGHIRHISFSLQIKSFARSHGSQDSRRTSTSTPSDFLSASPNTTATLPSYKSPELSSRQELPEQQPRTPAELLGIALESHEQKSISALANTAVLHPHFPSRPEPCQMSSSSNSGHRLLNPRPSPSTDAHIFELEGSMIQPKDIINVDTQTMPDFSSLSLDGHFTRSRITSEDVASQVFSSTSPELSSTDSASRGGATGRQSRQESVFSLEGTLPENLLPNLRRASIGFEKRNVRVQQAVEKMESFDRSQSKQRYVVIYPPRDLNVRYYLRLSATQATIPHVEHPSAVKSNLVHQVKLEKTDLRSERLPSVSPRDASLSLPDDSITASSAGSVRSLSSIDSASQNAAGLSKEHHRQVYSFGSYDDCKRFQELIMGPGTELQAQVPVWEVTSKYCNHQAVKESKLQCLRLWRRGRYQYLLFFANASSQTYQEFPMNYLRPKESRSKTSVKLEVELPGFMRRRGSRTKSPLLIAAHPTSDAGLDIGLTGPLDMENLQKLDSLSIDFEDAEHKAAFLRAARFHGFTDDKDLSTSQPVSRLVTV